MDGQTAQAFLQLLLFTGFSIVCPIVVFLLVTGLTDDGYSNDDWR